MPCVLDDAALWRLLHEDVPFGDLTTRALEIGGQAGFMVFASRQPMTLCGTEEAARLIALAGAGVESFIPSGTALEADTEFLHAYGSAAALHQVWKTAQTLVEYLSGIATCTASMVARLREAGHAVPLACTRKNFPGLRVLSAKAVMAGGAILHRAGLSETLLVFPEHRAFLATDALAEQLAALKRSNPEKKVVVEVGSLDDALACAAAGADILQLERFSPAELAHCKTVLDEAGLHPLVAPAGGVTRANMLDYAEAGADFLVSSAPYFAPPQDVKVSLYPA